MSLRPASYKGVSFYVEDTGASFGRRTVLHKYPYRDLPFAEDLGRDARRFTFSAFVMSKSAHKSLIDVLESEGGGTLIHPFYGSQFVVPEGQGQAQYPKHEKGRFVFQLSFVEAGENTEPDAQEDAAGLLQSYIDSALEAVGAEFASGWFADVGNWSDIASLRIDSLLSALTSYLDPLAQAASAFTSLFSGGSSLLSDPSALFSRITGLTGGIGNSSAPFALKQSGTASLLASSAFTATAKKNANELMLAELSGTGNTGSSRPTWTYPYTTSGTDDIPPLPPTLADAVRRTLVLQQAADIGTQEYDSRSDITAARDNIISSLESELYLASGDVYRRLQEVRMQVAATAAARLPTLQEAAEIETKTVIPALVLAYRVNGSIEGYDDVVARNKVIHPLFVPAGKVEVLRDGR